MAYDLPPPAAPPYKTSLSDADRKLVWGPGFGLNTMSCATSTSYSGATACAGTVSATGGATVSTVVVGLCVCPDPLAFELFDLLKGFFEPLGKLAFNCRCFSTFLLNFDSLL